MGCGGGCGGAKAQAASVAKPYMAEMPDGTKVQVENKTQERVERDKVWHRMQMQARKNGYRIQS